MFDTDKVDNNTQQDKLKALKDALYRVKAASGAIATGNSAMRQANTSDAPPDPGTLIGRLRMLEMSLVDVRATQAVVLGYFAGPIPSLRAADGLATERDRDAVYTVEELVESLGRLADQICNGAVELRQRVGG